MDASEMTNEELAKLISEGCGTSLMGHAIREAAARLRKQYKSCKECEAKCDPQFCDYLAASCGERENVRRRLKVADDALVKLEGSESTNRDWYRCYAREALAAIRNEGGGE